MSIIKLFKGISSYQFVPSFQHILMNKESVFMCTESVFSESFWIRYYMLISNFSNCVCLNSTTSP